MSTKELQVQADRPAPTSRIAVLIVDDHPLIRDGLRGYFGTAADICVVGDCGRGEDVLPMVASLQPDVVTMDMKLAGAQSSGADITRQVLSAYPKTKVLALSAYLDERYVLAAVEAGVCGYLLKYAPQTQILDAIRTVASGQTIFDPEVTRILGVYIRHRQHVGGDDDEMQQGERLTPREWEVLEQLAADKSNAEIAEALVIDVATVKTHVSRVLRKLNVEDRKGAGLWYSLHHNDE